LIFQEIKEFASTFNDLSLIEGILSRAGCRQGAALIGIIKWTVSGLVIVDFSGLEKMPWHTPLESKKKYSFCRGCDFM
jgi:hypothetical protein